MRVRAAVEGGEFSPDARGVATAPPPLRAAAHAAAALLLAVAVLLGPVSARAQGTAPQPAPAAEAASQGQTPAQNQAQAPADDKAAAAASEGQEQENAAAPGEGGNNTDNTAKINLPGVNVEGKRNVFNDNDKKLKQLQDSLPCTGCDAKPHTKKKFVKRVLDAVGDRVLPTEAPDHSTHDANDKALEFSQQGNCSGANVKQCTPTNAQP